MIRPGTLKTCRFALQRVLSCAEGDLPSPLLAQVEEALKEANVDWSWLNSVQRQAGTSTMVLDDRLLISAPDEDVEPLIRLLQVGMEAIRHEKETAGMALSPKYRRKVLKAGGVLLRSMTGGQ